MRHRSAGGSDAPVVPRQFLRSASPESRPRVNIPAAPMVLINAANLRVGGAVQVAASLVDEIRILARDRDIIDKYSWIDGITYEVSSQVARNMVSGSRAEVVKVSTKEWSRVGAWAPSRRKQFDLEYIIFGPRYGFRRASTTIAGLADVTSVYRWPVGVARGSLPQRLRRAVRGAISRTIFSNEDYIISESRTLADAFCRRTNFPRTRASVIPNVINRGVLEVGNRKPLGVSLRQSVGAETLLLAYVARGYPHKNHEFLPRVAIAARERGLDLRFAVTLSDLEWEGMSAAFKDAAINLGVVTVAQLADLYCQCDGVIFPSLLESYSATPLEAITVNGLLFASDRGFVRDAVGDAALYFDPLDPADCAEIIAEAFSDKRAIDDIRRVALRTAAMLPNARDRAIATIEAIDCSAVSI